jgi:2-hydroxychromene-2-carboxylate isomerase
LAFVESGPDIDAVEFFFDPMCPWAYQTSRWIRAVRARTGLTIDWRFFSLEEINRVEGKKHPWERDFAYGWTPMRVGAWLRRIDPALLDAWYEVCGQALFDEGRRPYDIDVRAELLAKIGAPASAWDDAVADPTTHDDVRADHERAVHDFGGFGVPIIVFRWGRAVFGPCAAPAPVDGEAVVALWDLTVAYAKVEHLYELKTPKTLTAQRDLANLFSPYLQAREWRTIQNPAP